MADERRKGVKGGLCGIFGCDLKHYGRGLCSKHYTRLKRHGSTDDPRPYVGLPDGMRWCGHCKTVKAETEFYPNRAKRDGLSLWCKDCDRAKAQRHRDENREAVREYGRRRYAENREACLEEARRYREANRELHRARVKAQRAKRMGCDVEEIFTNEEILDRDGWICGICGDPIPRDVEWPGALSPSVDHIVPLAHGGPHSQANVQAAHLQCNCRKHLGTGAGLRNTEMGCG